jgi:dipeptidyl-peptidase-4
VTNVFIDTDEAWIDITHHLHFINNGNQFVYISDRGGWKQCYLVSLTPNEASSLVTLTPPSFDVESIVGNDDLSQHVYFIASPDDPLTRYLYRVNYDGSDLTRVTPTSNEYSGTNGYTVSTDGKFAVHTFSSVERPTITRIIALPSHEEQSLLASNITLLTKFNIAALPNVEYFTVNIPSSDDESNESIIELNAWAILPPNFDPNAKYPVIFHVYGEPAAQVS